MKIKRADIERILILCAAALVVVLALRSNDQTTSQVLVEQTAIPIEQTIAQEDTVATVAEALCKKLELKEGDKAFVMINGCGATTMMEMLVLFKDTVEFLRAKGVEVVASMVGEILTVQEAGGFQMNIAKWDDETLRLWNTSCHTPAYSKE